MPDCLNEKQTVRTKFIMLIRRTGIEIHLYDLRPAPVCLSIGMPQQCKIPYMSIPCISYTMYPTFNRSSGENMQSTLIEWMKLRKKKCRRR